MAETESTLERTRGERGRRSAKIRNLQPVRTGAILDTRYELIDHLGRGGMGSVYLARQLELDRLVAVKVLHAHLSRDPVSSQRFIFEAKTVATLNHDHIVQVIDVGKISSGQAYFVMEYLEGEDLASLLARDGPIPWTRCRAMLLQLCDALQHAHERGVVHRDLKPSNIIRAPRPGSPDHVKLVDFGIAKQSTEGRGQTRTGELMGTPMYMAPEHLSGKPVDGRADIYALGVIAFKLLTGIAPFRHRDPMQLLTEILMEGPRALSESAPGLELPPGLEAVIATAMHRDANKRYASTRIFAAELDALDAVGSPKQTPHYIGAGTSHLTSPLSPQTGATEVNNWTLDSSRTLSSTASGSSQRGTSLRLLPQAIIALALLVPLALFDVDGFLRVALWRTEPTSTVSADAPTDGAIDKAEAAPTVVEVPYQRQALPTRPEDPRLESAPGQEAPEAEPAPLPPPTDARPNKRTRTSRSTARTNKTAKAVERQLARIDRTKAKSCGEHAGALPGDTARVRVHINSDGHVVESELISRQWAESELERCLLRAIRSSRYPKFRGEDYAEVFTFHVGKKQESP